jgi:hypothetical protein
MYKLVFFGFCVCVCMDTSSAFGTCEIYWEKDMCTFFCYLFWPCVYISMMADTDTHIKHMQVFIHISCK